MKVIDIVNFFEQLAPLSYQESYDNSGLIIGDKQMEVKSVLLSLDVTPEVVREAIEIGANVVVSHHPIIFSGLKRITGSSYVEQSVILAIKNDIAIYASHTNFDSIKEGVNKAIAEKLGVENLQILQPISNELVKLVTFVPKDHAENVRHALFNAGAGHIGNYDNCSYNTEGFGTFRAGKNTNPFVGDKGIEHHEPEVRVETILPKSIQGNVLKALIESHPYEEVAYDLYPLNNRFAEVGLGMIGDLNVEIDPMDFLKKIKSRFCAGCVRYTKLPSKKIKRVAFCGGSGASLLKAAIASRADAFVTADFKYHQFFDAEDKILIVDIGHFESEQFTIDLFYDYLSKKFSNFAVFKSKIKTNPINYL
ncbi:MAG: Nif3-like dinuclear metal center hexameric protein [Bacteroidales bacterium]